MVRSGMKKEISITSYPKSEEEYGEEEESIIFEIEGFLDDLGLMGSCGIETYPKSYIPDEDNELKYSLQGRFYWVEDPSDKEESPTVAEGYFVAELTEQSPNSEDVVMDSVSINFDAKDVSDIKKTCNL